MVVSKVGRELYEKFFRGYSRKQWGVDPSELDASVTSRVPTRTLDHPNIKVLLKTDYREVVDFFPFREMIYTGPVDEYFDFCYGKLPYRSLHFKHETHDRPVFQPAAVVNLLERTRFYAYH